MLGRDGSEGGELGERAWHAATIGLIATTGDTSNFDTVVRFRGKPFPIFL